MVGVCMLSGWSNTWVAPLAVMIVIVSMIVAVLLGTMLYVRCDIPKESSGCVSLC
jgi:hypothetical protein